LLGRTYALDLLKILGEGKFTFTSLLNEMKISRTTLSSTLQDLVEENYVSKETIGKYTVYRITEKGLEALQPRSQSFDAPLKQLTDYVAQRLREKGLFDRYEIDETELKEDVRKHVERLLKEILEDVEKSMKEAR